MGFVVVSDEALARLASKLDQLLAVVSKDLRPSEEHPWLPAREFCARYRMSRSTLARRAKGQESRIEILDPAEKIKKYRWRRDAV